MYTIPKGWRFIAGLLVLSTYTMDSILVQPWDTVTACTFHVLETENASDVFW